MNPDEWQAHVTREAALEIGRWLEARGRLHAPIASLGLGDLEAMASNAISRWIVMQTEKLQRAGWPPEDPIGSFLLGVSGVPETLQWSVSAANGRSPGDDPRRL